MLQNESILSKKANTPLLFVVRAKYSALRRSWVNYRRKFLFSEQDFQLTNEDLSLQKAHLENSLFKKTD